MYKGPSVCHQPPIVEISSIIQFPLNHKVATCASLKLPSSVSAYTAKGSTISYRSGLPAWSTRLHSSEASSSNCTRVMVSDESKSTQKIHYTQGQHSANIKRHAARTAEDCAAFVIPYLNKLPSNFKYLDLGCGPGSITVDLAQQYPQATFIGVDSGEKILEHAHALVKERGVENVTLLVGDLLDLDAARNGAFEWGSFDVVYCHQVLNHMQKPVDGLKVMRRAAKANGGIVAARESFSTGMQFYPEIPGTRQYINLLFEVNKQNGSDPDTGKKLIKLAMEAGWKRTQINGLAGASPMNTDAQRRAFAESAIEACRDTENHPGTKKLIELGLATKSELEGFANDWQEWLDDEGGWMTMVNGEIICTNSVE